MASNRSVRTNAFCRKIYQKRAYYFYIYVIFFVYNSLFKPFNKLKISVLFTPEKSETIIRECAYIHNYRNHCYTSLWPDSRVLTCECSTDGCNKGLSRHKNDHMYMPILYTILSAILRILF